MNESTENSGQNALIWKYKERDYPLYPVDAVQWAATEVIDPQTSKTVGILSHGFVWDAPAPFLAHQDSLKQKIEHLPGNRTRESSSNLAKADAELYETIIASGEYTGASGESQPETVTREEMLDLCGREDRSRAIRAFFNVTIREVLPEYGSGLELLRMNKSELKQYEMLIGNPSAPSAIILFTMRKSDIQSRENYEAAVTSTETLRRGQLPIEETTYNLQAQTNFAKKYFISAQGAAFRGADYETGFRNMADTDQKTRDDFKNEFLDRICPRWLGLLGDRHYASAAKTQGK